MGVWVFSVEKHKSKHFKKEVNVGWIEGKICEDVSKANSKELLKKTLFGLTVKPNGCFRNFGKDERLSSI